MIYYETNGEEVDMRDLEVRFDDYLDECGELDVAGVGLWPSEILKNTDPIAYREMMCGWVDYEVQDGRLLEAPPADEHEED